MKPEPLNRRMPPKKVVSPSRRCQGRVCGAEIPLGPGAKAKHYYAAEQCARACEEGSNLCPFCKKYEQAYMAGDKKLAAKFHGRITGPAPNASHTEGSKWYMEQQALVAAALLAANKAAEAAEVAAGAAAEAGAAAAGGGGGGGKARAKAKAKVAKEEAAVAVAAAEQAAAAAGRASSSEREWEFARSRAGMTITRGTDVVQIARGEQKEVEKALKAAQAAEKRAASAAVKAVAAAAGAKAAAAAPPPKTRKAPRIYNAASKGMPAGIPAANFLRTPSSPRVSGIRGHAPSPASRRSSRRASPAAAAARRSTSSRRGSPAAAAAAPSGFEDLDAELQAALANAGGGGPSVLNRNSF